jgi:hypothetical protein
MANRVLIGKGTTARGSSNYGAWVSRPGKDVLTCSDDELIFDTDKGGSADIKGLFQLQAVSVVSGVANGQATSGSLAANASATISYTDFSWNFGVVPIFGSAFSTSGTGSGTSFSGQSFTINSISTSGVNITNTTNSAQIFNFSVVPRFSSLALF